MRWFPCSRRIQCVSALQAQLSLLKRKQSAREVRREKRIEELRAESDVAFSQAAQVAVRARRGSCREYEAGAVSNEAHAPTSVVVEEDEDTR